MNVIIIGASGHWTYALNELKNHTVTAVCAGYEGEDVTSVGQTLTKNGIPFSYAETVSEALDGHPDIAIVNTRFDLNGVYTLECLKRGIYVFGEKPLATTLPLLDEIRGACKTAFPVAMFGISYEPWCETMKKHIGKIGEIRMVNCQKSYKLGTRPAFYGDKSMFGGLIPWVAIHTFHWCYAVTGLKYKRTVSLTNHEYNRGNGDLEMTAAALFEMENGCLMTVNADYFRPAGAPTHDDDRMRIVGTDGILEYQRGRVTLLNGDGETELPEEPMQDIFRLFVNRITDGVSGISPKESMDITEMALKCDETRMA